VRQSRVAAPVAAGAEEAADRLVAAAAAAAAEWDWALVRSAAESAPRRPRQVNRPVPARDAERFVRFMRDISFFVQVDGSWLGQRLGAFGQSRTTGVARFALVSCRQRTLDSGRS